MNMKKDKLAYRKRMIDKFERAVNKRDNSSKVWALRHMLLSDGKVIAIKDKKTAVKFSQFLREMFNDKKFSLELYEFLQKRLEEFNLESNYFTSLLIYIYTDIIDYFEEPKIGMIFSEKRYKLVNVNAKQEKTLTDILIEGCRVEENQKQFPVSIDISPYASIDEIIEFIREHSEEIKDHQKLYGRIHPKKIPDIALYHFMALERENGKTWKEVQDEIADKPEFEKYNELLSHELSKKFSKGKKFI